MLRQGDTRSTLNRIRKRQANFFGHVMRREKLHLVISRMIEGKRSRGKQREKIYDGQTNWLK